ncbi:hypothetical protein CRYUN_Cryun16bG0080900 [Craigia yunnanensis]
MATEQPPKTTMQEMKKSRTSNEFPIDRLSDLPDCLIHHILSLIDIKSAVQTCILSERWNNLWTSLPKFNFDSQSFNKLTPFKKFVHNVLSRCKANGLFSLRFCQTSRDQSFINRVLRYAVLHGVQEISLLNQYALHIGHFLFSCKSLRTLELQNCKLVESSCFFSLSRCVNLENLKMIGCYVNCGKTIKLSAPPLVKLTLAGVMNLSPWEKYELVLSAPRLSFFLYNGGYPIALSMNGCPVPEKMSIWLQASSTNSQQNTQEYYSQMKNLLQEVSIYSNLVHIQLDCWTVCYAIIFMVNIHILDIVEFLNGLANFNPYITYFQAISIMQDNVVGATIYNKETRGTEEFFLWNLQRHLLIQTNMIDSQRLISEFSGKIINGGNCKDCGYSFWESFSSNF